MIGILFFSCSDDDCDGTEVMIGNELQCIEGFGEVSDFELNAYCYHDNYGLIQFTDNGWITNHGVSILVE